MNSINCLRQTFGRKSLEILAKRLKPSVRAYCSPPQTEVYQAAVLNKFKNHLLLEKLARPNLADGEVKYVNLKCLHSVISIHYYR